MGKDKIAPISIPGNDPKLQRLIREINKRIADMNKLTAKKDGAEKIKKG